MTSHETIESWLERGNNEEYTHMIVVCDTFSYEDYPVYVTKAQEVRKIYDTLNGKEMQKVMEVYSYRNGR